MKTIVVLFLLFFGCHHVAVSQKVHVLTEDYKIAKDSCQTHVYELLDYLKGRGLFRGDVYQKTINGCLWWLKKSLQIDKNDFAKDYTFLIEWKGCENGDEEDISYGWFSIIELGYATEAKAKSVFDKASVASVNHTMNLPLYLPAFRCLRVGKNVIFVHSMCSTYDKYREMALEWIPGKK